MSTAATVTITEAEGGYRWTVTDDLGEFTSLLPGRDEALDHALMVARSHGYHDDEIDARSACERSQ